MKSCTGKRCVPINVKKHCKQALLVYSVFASAGESALTLVLTYAKISCEMYRYVLTGKQLEQTAISVQQMAMQIEETGK